MFTRPTVASFVFVWLAILLIIIGIEGQAATALAVIFAPGAIQDNS